MMRTFLAKRNVASKLLKIRQDSGELNSTEEFFEKRRISFQFLVYISCKVRRKQQPKASDDQAAITIQKAYRGFKVRQKYGPLLNAKTGQIDIATSNFIKTFAKRWREKSIFQVLLHYRAARYQDLVSLTQQIHIYNQATVAQLKANNDCLILDKIDAKETNPALLGPKRQAVNKLPFRLDEIPFFDTSYMCDPLTGSVVNMIDEDSDGEEWDAPLRRTINVSAQILDATKSYTEQSFVDIQPEIVDGRKQ